jgi:hypothetical protein
MNIGSRRQQLWTTTIVFVERSWHRINQQLASKEA